MFTAEPTPPTKLQQICDLHLQDENLWPETIKVKDGKNTLRTYCNIFVQRVCADMGYEKFLKPPPWGLNANQIFDACETWEDFLLISSDDANEYANRNRVVIAAAKGSPHGHVAIVYPGNIEVFSGKWNAYTIRVANVGKKIGVMGANYAFVEPPKLFLLR